MKGAILFSTQNAASLNIMRHLEKDWKWKKKSEALYSFSPCAKENCCSGVQAAGSPLPIIEIEPPADSHADYFLYASTHKSEAGTPALTAHVPGNWGAADFGGQPNTLNVAYACKLKQILQLLDEAAKKHKLDWPVNMEVDHHGPTPEGGKKALLFVEIGSGPDQWSNDLAGQVVAEAMMKALFQPAPEAKVYLGIGGGHYSPKFTPLMIGSKERAVGHVLAKYRAADFDAQMLKQAIEKTIEPVAGALIDWKGLGKEERERIISVLEKAGMKWERV
ncbi:MAG: D-aminoacyl-tRNA deacylase [Candidatus Marsarchaeota archaeon]|nr:D-aminoacyl-tRNA deacylase [Candidatus Marsarchaeota archaeon]